MMWCRSIHCIYQQKLNQQPPHCTCPTQTWLNSDVFKYLLILGNGFCWKCCYCIKCLHWECGKYCVDYWPEDPAVATTYIGWIWGLSLDVTLETTLFPFPWELMICKFPSLFLIVVFARAHLMSLPHLTINTSKFNTINISTFIPVNYSKLERMKNFLKTFFWTINSIMCFSNCIYLGFLVCRVYVIILVIVKSSFLNNDTHSMPWWHVGSVVRLDQHSMAPKDVWNCCSPV